MNLNSATWLKPLLLLAGIGLSTALFAQPKLFTVDLTNQSGTGGVKDYSTGFPFEGLSFGNYKLVVSADAGGDRFFRFRNAANTQDRRPNANGDIIALNQNTAYTSIFDGASNAFKITGTNTGYRYIFKSDGGVTKIAVIEIQGTNIESVSSVGQNPATGNVYSGQAVTVSATLSGSFSAGQAVWLRYTNNGYSTSTVVKMTGSGTSYSAAIPAGTNVSGSTISYYVFTSGDYGSAIAGADADLFTINANNNGGSNYSYTVQSWATANPGYWSSAATWTANAVPSTTENLGSVSINHSVSMDQDALVNGGTIGASGNLTVNSGSTLKTSNGLSNSGVFTVLGTFEITAGGYTNTGPVYSTGSTLRYNTGGSYSRNAEWSATTPYHVTINGNTTVSLGSGAGSYSINGDLTIASGSTLSMGSISGTLTLNGNLINNGTLTLSSASGGDLVAKQNVSFNSGSALNANSRAVFFSGTTDQTLTNTANVALAYLVADNSGGNIILGTDITLAGTTGDVLQLLNTNSIDLNGKTLTLSGNGGNILAGNAAGTSTRIIAGNSGTVSITGTKTVVSTNSKTLTFGSGITVLLTAGMNFGSSLSTLNGTLQINNGGFVSVNAPVYATGSVLKYNSGTTYGRNLEWASTSGAGYPYHVQISNSTTVDLGANGGTATARQLAGNLTVDAGSALTLATTAMTATLTVKGNMTIDGTLTLSGSGGGDLVSYGDFTVGSAGTFTGNGRAVFFYKNGNQQITKTGGGTVTIPYVLIGGSGNVSTVQLASGTNLTATAPSGGNAVSFNSSSDILELNGNTFSVTGGAFSGTGTLTGSSASALSVSGTGDAGTIRFTAGSRTLGTLTVNRTSSGKVTLGTNLSVTGTLTLTAGELALGSSTLTLSGTTTRTSGTLSSTSGAGNLTVTGTGDAGTVAFTTGANSVGTLTLNRTSSGKLSLASDLGIATSLTLTNGTLDLNGNNIVSLGSTGTVTESAGNSVINSNGSGTGYIEATYNAVAALTAENIGNLGFLVTTSGNPGLVTVRRFHTQRTVSAAGALSLKRYYYLNLAASNNGSAFQFIYNQTNDLNSLYENNLVAYHSADASSWTEETAGTGSLDATGNFYTRSGLSGYSTYYTLAEKFYTTSAPGNWNTGATWGGSVPPSGSSVTISHAVTLDVNADIGSLILSAGSLDLGSNTLTFADGARFTNNATFTPNTGTVVFQGAARIEGSSTPSFNVLTGGNGVISTFGNWSVSTFNKNTSTISFRDAGNISSATSFYNLTFESGTRTLLANIDVEGALTVDGGNLVTSGSRTLTLSGSNSLLDVNGNGTITGTDNGGGNDLYLVVSGGLTTVGGTRSLTGASLGRKFYQITVNPGSTLALSRGLQARYSTFTVNGTLQINANGFVETSVASSANVTYGVNGSLTYNNGGTYSVTTGEWPTTSGPKNVTIQNNSAIALVAASPRTLTGDLTLTSGTLDDNGNTLTVNKHVTGTSGVHTGSGKILLNGGSTHSLGGVTLGNVELNDAAGASLNGTTLITGTLTLTTGSLAIGSQSLELRNPLAGTATNLTGGTASTLIAGGSSSGILIPSSITSLNHFSATNTSVGGVTLAAPLTLEGNLTIGSGSTLNDASNTITVKGDVSNQGTHSGSGKVLMQGNASAASISGSGTFGNLEFNDSDGFTLSGDPSVSGTLTMTSGTISTGSNTLTLGISAAQPGTLVYTSGRIFGGFRRWFATSTVSNVLFPIGIVTASALVDLSFTAAPTTGGTLRASFSANPAGQNGLPLNDSGYQITTTASSGYWTISAANGLSGGTYSLNLTGENFGGIISYSSLRLIKRANSGSPWTVNGTHVPASGSNAIPVVKRSGLTGFSDFTIASDAADNSLPVELSEFSARQNGKKVTLAWTTESETNNAGFYIFRVMDGKEPVKVSDQLIKSGTSSSSSRTSYSFPDEPGLAEKKMLTYLIQSIDLDGTPHLSGKTAVLEYQPVPEKFAVGQNYPNPFNPETRFTLDLPEDGQVTIDIFSVTGQKVRTLLNEDRSAGSYELIWDGKTDASVSAASGLYWYRVTLKSGTSVKKMQLIR